MIEEIESVGRSEMRSLTSCCERAIAHVIKVEHWASATGEVLQGWAREVGRSGAGMADALGDNTGLRVDSEISGMYGKVSKRGKAAAAWALAD